MEPARASNHHTLRWSLSVSTGAILCFLPSSRAADTARENGTTCPSVLQARLNPQSCPSLLSGSSFSQHPLYPVAVVNLLHGQGPNTRPLLSLSADGTAPLLCPEGWGERPGATAAPHGPAARPAAPQLHAQVETTTHGTRACRKGIGFDGSPVFSPLHRLSQDLPNIPRICYCPIKPPNADLGYLYQRLEMTASSLLVSLHLLPFSLKSVTHT